LNNGDQHVKLTTKESDLLNLLCANANEVLEHNYALTKIWGVVDYFNARNMDVYITKLRKLLKDDTTIEIMNIHGKGYKLITPNETVIVGQEPNYTCLWKDREKRLMMSIKRFACWKKKMLTYTS
jgi:DNA-binding winged helix-turn-helix (wHTH) protein